MILFAGKRFTQGYCYQRRCKVVALRWVILQISDNYVGHLWIRDARRQTNRGGELRRIGYEASRAAHKACTHVRRVSRAICAYIKKEVSVLSSTWACPNRHYHRNPSHKLSLPQLSASAQGGAA